MRGNEASQSSWRPGRRIGVPSGLIQFQVMAILLELAETTIASCNWSIQEMWPTKEPLGPVPREKVIKTLLVSPAPASAFLCIWLHSQIPHWASRSGFQQLQTYIYSLSKPVDKGPSFPTVLADKASYSLWLVSLVSLVHPWTNHYGQDHAASSLVCQDGDTYPWLESKDGVTSAQMI